MKTDQYVRIYKKTIDESICFLAHWELTYKCNLRCRHCYISQQESREEVSFEKAKSIMDELKALGCLYLILSGGEILLRCDIFEIICYARKLGFALRLMTNATLIDETVSERLASLYPLVVETSIYAANGGGHDAITLSRGSFDKTMKAITFLKKRNVRVLLKFLIMKDNINEFKKVKSLAKSLDVDFAFDFTIVSKNDGSPFPLRYRLNRDELKDFFVTNNSPLNRIETPDDALLCTAGLNNIFISPELDVYPCIGIKQKLGNLWVDRLKDLWQSSKFNAIRELEASDLYKCIQCQLKQFCNRCLGIAFTEDGDMLGGSDFACTVAGVIEEVIKTRSCE